MEFSRLLESLKIENWDAAAIIAFHRFVSDRSVAIIDNRRESLSLGSGVIVKIASQYFVSTAGHVLEGVAPSDIALVPPGNICREELKACRTKAIGREGNYDIDVGWIELDPKQCERNRLPYTSLDQVRALQREDQVQACLLQGYPRDSAIILMSPEECRIKEVTSIGSLQLSIPPSLRRGRHQEGVDIAIEYPAHDGSLDAEGIPEPFGFSGGGVWLPRFVDYQVWSPERATLIGIDRGWRREKREATATRIEWWLRLVVEDFPALSGIIASHLRDNS